MVAKLLRWSSVGVFTLTTLAGCGDGKELENLKRESRDAWAGAKAWGVARRAEAEKVFKSSVDDLAATYETAKAKAKAAGKDVSTTLDPKWDEVKRKWEELKSASADKWEQARDAFSKAYEDFKKQVSSGS